MQASLAPPYKLVVRVSVVVAIRVLCFALLLLHDAANDRDNKKLWTCQDLSARATQ